MSAESSRFTHLLQPIRDLSKNWSIDLAQELEEYLDELEHLNIAFDPQDDDAGTANFSQASTTPSQAGGNRVMNFAEAALLIQGTSVIYSRKVEYLYALVFQTLAHLSKQHETQQHRNLLDQDGGTDDAVNGDSDSYNVFMNPLPIYNELEEARNITLKSNSAQTAESQKQRNNGSALIKSNTNIQAAISLMGSLIPDERDHGETFKLLSCNLHSSGVLLLDEASKKYLSDDFYDDENGQRGFGAVSSTSRFDSMPVAALNFDNVADNFFMDGGDDGGDDDDNGGYGDDDGNNDADYGYNDGYDGEENGDETGDADGATHQVSFATPTTANASANVRAMAQARRHKERDPWASLDPYDTSAAMTRPFRKGRSYPRKKEKHSKTNKKAKDGDNEEEVIDGLDDPQFKERFFFGASRPQWSSWVWTETNETAFETKFKKKFCKAPLLVKSCDKLWKLEAKWKSLVRRTEAKEEQSAQAILLQEQAEEEEEQMHAMGMNMVNGTNALDLDLQAHEDDNGDDDGYDDGADAGFDAGDWDIDEQQDAPAVNYMNESNDELRNYDDPGRPLTYEDICRQHIKSFMQGTEKYVRETDLSKQVNDWQTKLSPILKEQDQRPPFNIHTYGRDIIGHLEQETRVKQEEPKRKKPKQQKSGSDTDEKEDEEEISIPFGEIVGGMSQYQVCRMFLASLQLANNGNVLLRHGKTAAQQSRVPFEMQLLSTSNVYESLQQEA